MVPRIHAGGGSFSGVVAYLTHDAGTPDERRPTSADRMGLVELENLPACEPTTAARIMAGTAREADTLKRLAGVSTRGRKLDKPVYHYSLSWSPDERPVRAEMLEAARGSLQALGMADRQALVVEHTDRAHRHVHVVVNRVSADDGRAASSSNDARTLSSWARTWEREHGVVRCRRRRAPVLERAAASLTRIIKRQPPAPPLPPAQRRRGPGRHSRTPDDRRSWAAVYANQRTAGDGDPAQLASDRRDLARRQREEREERAVSQHRPSAEPTSQHVPALTRELRLTVEEVEMRLPRTPDPNDSSQRIPAVSDRTFNRVRSETRDPDARDALAFMQNLHGLSGPARGRAEQDHLRPAIDKKHDDIRQAHKDAWRRGAVETPDPPSRRVAVEQVIREFCAQVREVITSACRHIANLVEQEHRQRQRQEINRQLERARQHPELERGYDREGPSR